MEDNISLNGYSSPWPYEPQPKESLPLSIFLLMPFLIGSVTVSAVPGFNHLVVGLGAICAVVFLMASIREGFFVPADLKYFIAFFCWGILGLFAARQPPIVFERLRTVAQLVIMALIVSYYARNTRCVSWLFLAVLAGILVTAASAVITGEFGRAEVESEDARVAGLMMNANFFSRTVVYGIAILLYYFRMVRSKMLKLVIIGGILVSVRFVIASGSRQGFLGMVVLVFLWFLFTYARELRTRPILTMAMLLGSVALGLYTAYAVRDTVLMRRFLSLEAGTGAEGSAGGRVVMIKEGIRLTLSNPVVGVGLNNFQFHSVTEKYAHNNYTEVFATTGIPGGILYYLIYVMIFFRLHKIGKFPLAHGPKNVVTIFKCMMLVQLMFDFFVVSYYSKTTWIFLAIIIGGSSYLKRNIEAACRQNDETGGNIQSTPVAEQ